MSRSSLLSVTADRFEVSRLEVVGGRPSIFDGLTADDVRAAAADPGRRHAFHLVWRALGGPQAISSDGRRAWPSMWTTGEGSHKTEATSETVDEFILYLAPHREASAWLRSDAGMEIALRFPSLLASLRNVCRWSTAGCRAGCLFSAGRGDMPNVRAGRVARTLALHADPLGWLAVNYHALGLRNRRAELAGSLQRLNGTADIPFELHEATACLIEDHPALEFRDYTKAAPAERPAPTLGNYGLVRSAWTGRETIADVVALWRGGESVSLIVDDFEPLRGIERVFEASTSDAWLLFDGPWIGALKLLGDAVSADAYSGVELAEALRS